MSYKNSKKLKTRKAFSEKKEQRIRDIMDEHRGRLMSVDDFRCIAKEEALKPWKAAEKLLSLVIGVPLIGLVFDVLLLGIINLAGTCAGPACFVPLFTMLGILFGALIALELI